MTYVEAKTTTISLLLKYLEANLVSFLSKPQIRINCRVPISSCVSSLEKCLKFYSRIIFQV